MEKDTTTGAHLVVRARVEHDRERCSRLRRAVQSSRNAREDLHVRARDARERRRRCGGASRRTRVVHAFSGVHPRLVNARDEAPRRAGLGSLDVLWARSESHGKRRRRADRTRRGGASPRAKRPGKRASRRAPRVGSRLSSEDQAPSGPWSSSKSSVTTVRVFSSALARPAIFSIAYRTVEWSRPPK